ncbi:MAG: hypothetical protein EPO25_00260 [Gammaproteobacteria bacterium]|nr:MAG: hypothetical protein EPO25_00260 [Gammaproteobacteria bacterium]
MLAALAAVFLISFLAAPLLGSGWFWDAGNALGFAAYAGLLYLTATGRSVPDPRVHHLLGRGVLVIAAVHAFWFLLGDGAVVEYLKPGAPAHLWAGVAGLLLLGALVTGALLPERLRLHRDRPASRSWHRWLAIGAIATAAWHMLGSGLYLQSGYQALLLAGLALAACWPRAWRGSLLERPRAGLRDYLLATTILALVFAAIRNLPA